MQLELSQKQSLQLNPQLLQNMAVLQMGAPELNQYIRQLVQENPAAELVEPSLSRTVSDALRSPAGAGFSPLSPDRDSLDPLERVGTDGGLAETLPRHLNRQVDQRDLPPQLTAALRWLISCLDDNGYLRDDPAELERDGQMGPALFQEALSLLQSLDPPGVGARDLSQCLALQLERLGESGPALAIVRTHLEQLGKKQYHAIGQALNLSQDQVLEAQARIRTLNPRPGSGFAVRDTSCYIIPDLTVSEDDRGLTVSIQDSFLPTLKLNSYYQQLNQETQDPEVRQYLTEKLRQTRWAISAVEQRRTTLLSCARAIVDHQAAFFRPGGQLIPMRLADIAEKLGVHESTVSRAIREKYLECAHGVYPLSFFFSRTVGSEDTSVHQVKALLSRLIEEEDPAHPLSDQKLSDLLGEKGLEIARRTVAKYRAELGLPGTAGRRRAPL